MAYPPSDSQSAIFNFIAVPKTPSSVDKNENDAAPSSRTNAGRIDSVVGPVSSTRTHGVSTGVTSETAASNADRTDSIAAPPLTLTDIGLTRMQSVFLENQGLLEDDEHEEIWPVMLYRIATALSILKWRQTRGHEPPLESSVDLAIDMCHEDVEKFDINATIAGKAKTKELAEEVVETYPLGRIMENLLACYKCRLHWRIPKMEFLLLAAFYQFMGSTEQRIELVEEWLHEKVKKRDEYPEGPMSEEVMGGEEW